MSHVVSLLTVPFYVVEGERLGCFLTHKPRSLSFLVTCLRTLGTFRILLVNSSDGKGPPGVLFNEVSQDRVRFFRTGKVLFLYCTGDP